MAKVFIFAGQSNAQGYGKRIQLDPVPSWAQNAANGWEGAPTESSDSGVQYPKPTATNAPSLYCENNSGLLSNVTDGWGTYDGENPAFGFHPGEQGSYGPELSFLAKYRAEHPTEDIVVIKVVLGGSNIVEWLDGGNMHDVLSLHISQAKARLAAASISYEWAGLIWHQGESGASKVWEYLNTPTLYASQLRTFLSEVRGMTDAAMPVVIARIGDQMLADAVITPMATGGLNTSENLIGATNNRRAQQVAVAADAGNAWADTDGLPVLESGSAAYWYHHTGAGYLAMGERLYAAWQLGVGEVPPPPPEPLKVNVTIGGVLDATKTAAVCLNGAPVGGDDDVLDIEITDI